MNAIIVGGGKVGMRRAVLLQAAQHQVTVVEVRAEHVAEVVRSVPGVQVVAGSGADPELLERAGIRRAQVLAAVTGSDEINLVATTLARFEFGLSRTIARVNNPANAWLYNEVMGVDVALNQAELMAHLILEEMSLGDMMTLLKLRRGAYSLVEEKVDPQAEAVGRRVADLALPEECVLTALFRGGRLLLPKGETVLQPADEVVAIVASAQVDRLAAILSASGPQRAARAGGED